MRLPAIFLLPLCLFACTGVLTPGGGGGDEGPDSGDGDSVKGPDAGSTPSGVGLFSYPLGDLETYPAGGGFQVWQVLGHYWDAYGGRHLAQDLGSINGGQTGVDAPVHSVADGVVRYAGPNSSSYVNVVLIEHPLEDGSSVCSFYGHVNTPLVATGESVNRGDQITSVLDWAKTGLGASSNTHLHYVFLSKDLCDASAGLQGQLICGYDRGGPNAIDSLESEPMHYTSEGDDCGVWQHANAFISPTRFIEANRFDR